MKHMKFHEKQGLLGGFRRRSTFNAQVSVQNLECGDKSRAVRGSRHRFLSALCAETLLVLTLNAFALALVCGCAVCEKTAQPAIGPAAPLVFMHWPFDEMTANEDGTFTTPEATGSGATMTLGRT